VVSKTSFRDSDGNIIKFEHCDALRSTTELAREYARSGYPDRYVIFTEKQSTSAITKTKLSEGAYEHGMFISCILRPSIFPSQAGLLGPLSAVALVTALEEHTTKQLGIGWVSDVYCDGVRIGGAAIEGKLDSHSTYEYLIVSFAIRMRDADFPPRLTDMIRKVFESENASIPMIIAKTVLTKFFSVYSGLKNPAKHINTYRNKFLLIGKKIKFAADGKRRSGKVVDIDSKNCTLYVETRHGEVRQLTSPSGVILPRKIKLSQTRRYPILLGLDMLNLYKTALRRKVGARRKQMYYGHEQHRDTQEF